MKRILIILFLLITFKCYSQAEFISAKFYSVAGLDDDTVIVGQERSSSFPISFLYDTETQLITITSQKEIDNVHIQIIDNIGNVVFDGYINVSSIPYVFSCGIIKYNLNKYRIEISYIDFIFYGYFHY